MNQIAELQLADLERSIASVLEAPTYGLDPNRRRNALFALLKQELEYGSQKNPRFGNYVRHWPVRLRGAKTIADLPYLPVSAFRANPPLSLVPDDEIKRTLTSSASSGQVPSRIVLDDATSRRITKGVLTVIRDFIGAARRPYLVIDTKENLGHQTELGARGAAIQALASFATEIVPCLSADTQGEPGLDLQQLMQCVERWKGARVLVYGFTYVIWTQFVQPLKRKGIALDLPNVYILHSGGWKRLEQQAVSKDVFARETAAIFGCPADRVIDYYGMVENVGVVYPDCERGFKHVPSFAEVIVRDPLTLAPAEPGTPGLVQLCSVLPTSFPGFLLLTDDMGEIVGQDGCGCGRRGSHFRFLRRVPNVEVRGCGNLETIRRRSGGAGEWAS
jgi:hypothetical protein